MSMRVNIGDPKTKKCLKKEVTEDAAKKFVGLKIGDKFKGELIDMTGYEFEITGGSDQCGFPMRKDVKGSLRKGIFTTNSTGVHEAKRNGMRIRKTVAGNTIHEKTSQINVKVIKYGKGPLFEEKKEVPAEGKAAKDAASEKAAEEKKEDKKE